MVGDAGYFKDPITTHGMTDALRDAELLTDEILETLTGIVPEAVALARYQATRERLSSRLFEANEGGRVPTGTRAGEPCCGRSYDERRVLHLQSLP